MLTAEILLTKVNGRAVGSLIADQPPGSLTLPPPPGSPAGTPPRMLLFGWIEHQPGVWESRLGWDVDLGKLRVVGWLDLVQVSMLTEPYEIDYWPRVRPRMLAKLRFELVRADS